MKVLFLSALDFKAKSIQVIRKTPEAYARRGWQVKYIVGRDTSRYGNYGYEEILDPPCLDVERFHWPFVSLRDRTRGVLRVLLTRLAIWVTVLRLAIRGLRAARAEGPYDLIYGYESQGVLAAALVRLALFIFPHHRKTRYVSRFQGTVLEPIIKDRRYFELLKKWDAVLAGFLPCDLSIMTDDGTHGLSFLRRIRTRAKAICFWPNGADPPSRVAAPVDWERLGVRPDDRVILCVSRLVGWKRLDRAIRCLARILDRAPSPEQARAVKLVVVGGGEQMPEYCRLAEALGLGKQVTFVGPVPHDAVAAYFDRADYFFSFYDLSNVGNPLLEAIRHHKIVFTLRNGATGDWIEDGTNGFLFEPDDATLPDRVAEAFWGAEADPAQRARIRSGVQALESRRLWTWDQRLTAEIDRVETLYAA
jgi:glycosyltransferase involved in cell wall biosynthesis